MSGPTNTDGWQVGLHKTQWGTSGKGVLAILILLPVMAMVALLYFFDPNGYSFYPTCFFHQSTGLLCPGCGSLRAIHQLLHGHFSAAFQYNPMLVTSLPLLAGCSGLILVGRLRHKPSGLRLQGKWVWFIIGLALAFSIWRNLPGSPWAIH